MEKMLLKDARLIGELTEGSDLARAEILISGNKIEKILPVGALSAEEPGDVKVLDLKGKTLMPGMIEAHVHLSMAKSYGPMDVITACGRSFDVLKFAQYLLKLGFTTVRDMGDYDDYPTVALRNAIDEGVVVGPRIKCSGVTIIPYDTGFQCDPHFCCFTNGPEEMRRNARYQIMYGADQIKIYGTGSMLCVGSEPGLRLFEEDEILEAVRVAERKNTYVACHCHGGEAIDTMVRCGVRTIEHASFIRDDTCRVLDGREDVGLVPTVGLVSDAVIEGKTAALASVYKERQKMVFESIGNAYHNYDILMGWGTDMHFDQFSQDPYIEFKTRANALGFSAIDMLKQLTINSAKLMKMDHMIGTVKEGKLADLIVVDGNPDEDITVLYQQPVHIIADGQLVKL